MLQIEPNSLNIYKLSSLKILMLVILAMSYSACRERVYQLIPSVRLQKYFYCPGDTIKIRYSFKVSIREKIPFNGIVRVTFYDPEKKIAFVDTHRPPIKTSDWIPGSVIEYQRCTNIPIDAKPGRYSITLGLYDADTGHGIRLPAPLFANYDYIMTGFTVQEILFMRGFNDSVYQYSICQDPPPRSMQNNAILFMTNPGKDITLHISIQPLEELTTTDSQKSSVYLNDRLIDTIMFTSGSEIKKDYAIRAGSLGKNKYFAVRIESENGISKTEYYLNLNYIFYDYQE